MTSGPQLQALDPQVDHLRGPLGAAELLVYGDYECPYTRKAMRQIEVLQREDDKVLFVYRHFPLVEIHPHALIAAAAAEAAARQQRFWEMHDVLFHRQHALSDEDLLGYASELGLDVERFAADRESEAVGARIARDVESGVAAGVDGTPGIFIARERYLEPYDAPRLREALAHAT